MDMLLILDAGVIVLFLGIIIRRLGDIREELRKLNKKNQ